MKVKGTSQTSDAPMLNRAFWKPGRTVAGTITRHVQTQYGPIMELKLDTPLKVKGDPTKGVAERTLAHAMLGNQRGLQTAAENVNVEWPYPIGTHVKIKATGTQHTVRGDMVMFEVEFDLPEDVDNSQVQAPNWDDIA